MQRLAILTLSLAGLLMLAACAPQLAPPRDTTAAPQPEKPALPSGGGSVY